MPLKYSHLVDKIKPMHPLVFIYKERCDDIGFFSHCHFNCRNEYRWL